MKLFKCDSCGQTLYFENVRCETCGHRLGYAADRVGLLALRPDGDSWRSVAGGPAWRFCGNARFGVCNWLVPAQGGDLYCGACRHNRTIPDLGPAANLPRWHRLEDAKHRLFYTLMRLGLPLRNRIDDPGHGLVFDFLAADAMPEGQAVMTGHDEGLITIALEEADDAERERRRVSMHEPYRTLLGHFRHEVGHHFWDLLIRDGGRLEECGAHFGDERRDYAEALKAHYENGAPADWGERFISAYASAHPWEDWAETWAHYLHIVDTLEMAAAFGLRIRPRLAEGAGLSAEIDFDPHQAADARELVDAWLPLCFAMNSLNRTMGHQDLYPFVLSPKVIGKLDYIHSVVRGQKDRPAVPTQPVPS